MQCRGLRSDDDKILHLCNFLNEDSCNISFRKWCKIGHNGWIRGRPSMSGHSTMSLSLLSSFSMMHFSVWWINGTHSAERSSTNNNSIISKFLSRMFRDGKFSMEEDAAEERDKQHKMELIAISDIDECNFRCIENGHFLRFLLFYIILCFMFQSFLLHKPDIQKIIKLNCSAEWLLEETGSIWHGRWQEFASCLRVFDCAIDKNVTDLMFDQKLVTWVFHFAANFYNSKIKCAIFFTFRMKWLWGEIVLVK